MAIVKSLIPEVSILANGKSDSITVKQGDNLTLSVSLNPNTLGGELADYWVEVLTPVGTYWLNDQLQFVASDKPIRVFGGPLVNIFSFSLFDNATSDLPPGVYTISFSVDDNMNNAYDATFRNSVVFTVSP